MRILAQGLVWAGPFATLILSDLGAEVIEIESIQHLNPTRTTLRHLPQNLLGGQTGAYYVDRDPSEGFWDRQAWFNYGKRGCKSVTLDLRSERGHELFLELAKVSDAFIENNAVGVVEGLGIDYPVLREANPRLIMVRFPGFGLDGPYRAYKGYGTNMEGVAGHTLLRGYEDADPSMTTNALHGDANAGTQVAFAVQAALIARRRTGEGQLVELSQAEAVTHHLTYAFMDFAMNGRVQGHPGNRHPSMAPYGAYRCAGDDNWIAIAVPDDAAFSSLAELMGRRDLAEDARFADVVSRRARAAELDEIVGAWTSSQDGPQLAVRLQGLGVPATFLMHQEDAFDDPQLRAREFFQRIEHPAAGSHLYPGPMAHFEPPLLPARPAPTLGQHNEEILRGLLGLTSEEYEQLVADEVVGNTYLESATS